MNGGVLKGAVSAGHSLVGLDFGGVPRETMPVGHTPLNTQNFSLVWVVKNGLEHVGSLACGPELACFQSACWG